MQLVSYLLDGAETLGALHDGRVLPARALSDAAPTTAAELLADPDAGLAALRHAVSASADAFATRGTPLAQVDLLAPLPRPANVICIGRNYREHANEEGKEPPEAPAIFLKTTTSVVAHRADVTWDPDYTTQVDYEAELAVVIGRTARHVSVEHALDHVLGYTCLNDVSARDLQFADLQWTRGKSLDTFCPMGPALVTADEVGDPQALDVRCLVNGEVVQRAGTADMYHSVAEIIAYCSRAFTLHPGDVIATGTPGGVGIFRDPPLLLGDGDEVVVDISGVGRLVNTCRTTKNG
jgi:2-keto-4-pentenoate hydratase/2-oxohepta-3-ene-1,7-dioic acid hydratase in catechol pathway